MLVLAKGYELFYGSPDESEAWFTSSLGAKRPAHTCPADFILDQANIDFDKSPNSGGKGNHHHHHQEEEQPHALSTIHDLKKAADDFRAKHPHVFEAAVVVPVVMVVPDEESKDDDATSRPPVDRNLTSSPACWTQRYGELLLNSKSKAHTITNPATIVHRTPASWTAKYRVLLCRNYRNYIRNYGNVLARIIVNLNAAVMTGLVYRNMGAEPRTPEVLRNLMGK